MPSLTATPISLARTRESHFISSRTSRWISSSERTLTAMLHVSFPLFALLLHSCCQAKSLAVSSQCLCCMCHLAQQAARRRDELAFTVYLYGKETGAEIHS